MAKKLWALEICAGAGGQALGIEAAGFAHSGAVEIDPSACATLRLNRPRWNVLESDIRNVNGRDFRGIDLLAGGVPCPPFSIAGRQLGRDDERDLFPEALRLVAEAEPTAVLLENVRGLASEKFSPYRNEILRSLHKLGYVASWQVLNASDYGTPQLRPRFLLVAFRGGHAERFVWPEREAPHRTVGKAIGDLMAARGWKGAEAWALRANKVAPTIVGGSKKHGGPDLGPTRARKEWAALGVDGLGVADEAPPADFRVDGLPRLTVRMVARLQGFPDTWTFSGRKTASYRQVGNAFPPPVAERVGASIRRAILGGGRARSIHGPLFDVQPNAALRA